MSKISITGCGKFATNLYKLVNIISSNVAYGALYSIFRYRIEYNAFVCYTRSVLANLFEGKCFGRCVRG